MPEISRFLGIVIAMYYKDHVPPHFHARYGSFEITVSIADCVSPGRTPRELERGPKTPDFAPN